MSVVISFVPEVFIDQLYSFILKCEIKGATEF